MEAKQIGVVARGGDFGWGELGEGDPKGINFQLYNK